MVARLELAGNGASDLLYATLVGGIATSTNTNLTGLALDEYGDVYIAGYHGRNNNPTTNTYPTTANAFQPANAGGRDAVIAHLPLLPGGLPGICVIRQQQALATPACGAAPIPLYTGMAQAPVPGVTVGFTATNAPRAAPGALVLGTATPPVQLLNTWLLAIPGAILFRPSNPLGFARQDIVVPPGLVPVACWGLSAQWLFLDNGACTGRLATSERLDF
jgi:hypothetical protein